MFDRLIHADWSVAPAKRWMAIAERPTAGWIVVAPELVGDTRLFLDKAFFLVSQGRRILASFDFPIGVPSAYGSRTGLKTFGDFLNAIGEGDWSHFFEVARSPTDIGIGRPFYPAVSKKGVSRAELVTGLSVRGFDDLLRVCERRTAHRQAACSLFWTLGGNQVGKGALSGWREIVRPALLRGAFLWPFDGRLADLANAPCLVVAETYPAEAYHMMNAGFLPHQSKRRQADRREKSSAVLAWAERHAVTFTAEACAALNEGFGAKANGEDQFDAVMGLLKMIDVVEGRRDERSEQSPQTADWEGWILGR
jgi:hypothetical protein